MTNTPIQGSQAETIIAEAGDVPGAFWAEADGYVTGYMCMVDWECEIGGAIGGSTVYPSAEDCKHKRPCVDQCGLVEVRVIATRIVQPQAFPPFDDEEEAPGMSTGTAETLQGAQGEACQPGPQEAP